MNGGIAERDLRAKISAKADQALAAVALARGLDKQEVVREILDQWADRVLHEANLLVRFAAGEGSQGRGAE